MRCVLPVKGLIVIDDFAPPSPALPTGELAALLPVANRPLALHALDTVRRSGAADVAFVVPARHAERLRAVLAAGGEPTVPPTVLEAETTRSLTDALAGAQAFVEQQRFIVHRASGIWTGSVAPLRRALGSSRDEATLFAQPSGVGTRPAVGNAFADRTPAEDPLEREFAGVQVFGAGALGLLEDLEDDLGALDRADVTVQAVPRQWFACGGNPADVVAANRAALDHLDDDAWHRLGPECRVEGRVHVDPSATVTHSLLRGPVAVGPGAHIEHACLGPYTAVGAGAVVENSDVIASVLCAGAVVRDVNARVESSVVGPDAVVCGDFMLPRSVRLALGQGATVSLA